MNEDELKTLIREIAVERYPDTHRQANPPELANGGYILDPDGACCLIRVWMSSIPIVWIRAGVAIAIPRSDQLAYFVAQRNKELVAGRAYLVADEQLTFVALDENVFGAALSWQHEPSIVDLLNRLETIIAQSQAIGTEVRERFGGRPFGTDEWTQLIL